MNRYEMEARLADLDTQISGANQWGAGVAARYMGAQKQIGVEAIEALDAATAN